MNYDRNKLNPITSVLVLAVVLLATGIVSAQQFSNRPKATRFAPQGSNSPANAMFTGARDLIDDAQWAKAESAFSQYIATYPKEKNLDAAMYWVAYSQYKLRKFQQSKDTIGQLLQTYQTSPWKEDAELLLAQLPGGVTVKVDPVTVTVDPVVVTPVAVPPVFVGPVAVAPVAVGPGTAGPVVAPVAVAAQDPTQDVQERIVEAQARAQERAREAQERVEERMAEAREKMKDKTFFKYDLDLGLGMGMGRGRGEATSDDDPCELKIVVLQALFESDPQRGVSVATDWLKPNSGQTVSCKRAALTLLARHGGKAVTPTILSVAQSDADLKVRTRAISVLGATNDDTVVDALRDFALNSPQTEITEAALYALSQHTSPRAANVLADIALSSKPVALRKTAIGSIAGRPGEPAVDALLKIYDSTQDIEIRKSVISGLSRRKSDRAGARLLEIARSGDNLELRKAAMSGIGRRGGDQAIDALVGLYDSEKNEELKDQLMNAMAYSNDQRVTRKLIEIAKNPQTPMDRRRRAIMILSNRSKDPEVLKFLEDLLKQ